MKNLNYWQIFKKSGALLSISISSLWLNTQQLFAWIVVNSRHSFTISRVFKNANFLLWNYFIHNRLSEQIHNHFWNRKFLASSSNYAMNSSSNLKQIKLYELLFHNIASRVNKNKCFEMIYLISIQCRLSKPICYHLWTE